MVVGAHEGQKKSLESSGAVVMDDSEPPGVDAGNGILVLYLEDWFFFLNYVYVSAEYG